MTTTRARTMQAMFLMIVAMAGIGVASASRVDTAVPQAGQDPARDAPPLALLEMHDDFVSAFVESEGFGYMRVTPMMRVMQRYRTQGAPSLQVMGVELVGIAKHDPPVVFASPFQGFLHAADSPSGGEIVVQPQREGRPLTPAEQAAVRAMENGARLLVDDEGLRVTGPIRARKSCLGCHKGKRTGDLLGAFVYTLVPVPVDAR